MKDQLNIFIRIALLGGCLIFMLPSYSLAPPAAVKVAVIDTGMDIRHASLSQHIWRNSGEEGVDKLGRDKRTNGVDDDRNGFIDDLHGWNFAGNNADLSDEDGHGTHIGGIVAKVASEQAPGVGFELMTLKYYSKSLSPRLRTRAFIRALKYAVDMNADIINISGGGPKFDENELEILKQAADKGIVIVASAGNKNPEDRDKDFYPASYELSNVLSVIATDQFGKVLKTSNTNIHKTNLYAAGEQILSALPDNKFGRKTGSSQAAAVLTGNIIEHISAGKFINLDDLKRTSSIVNNSTQPRLFVSNSPN